MAAALLVACTAPARSRETLEVLLPAAPIEIDPRFVLDAQGLRVSRLLFSGLVSLDPYTLAVEPELAEHIAISPSGREITVTLRPDLTFSDGSTLDADDVRATYESVLDPDFGSRFRETYARIERIETPDARTVIFVLSGPHAPFLTDLELPIVRREDRDRHLRADELPRGSGPYALQAASDRAFSLEARPGYVREAAHPRVHLLVVRDESTRALRLLGDAADVAPPFSIAPLLVPSFEEDPRFVVHSAPGPGTAYLAFHTGRGALVDARVRRALAHAIDRPALIASKFGSRAELATGFLPTAHWAHVSLPSPDFDPARARALLDAAGYPDPEGPAPRLSLRIRTSTDRTRMSIARAMAAMWSDIGVEVEVRSTETATLLADLDAGRFDLALMTLPEVFEPHVLHWFFASSRSEGGPPNRFRFADAAFDEALERGRVAVDRAERFAAYSEAQSRLAEALPAFPLWHEHVVVVARSELSITAPSDGRLGFLARSAPEPAP